MTGPIAPVAPEVLRWARESAGITEEEAARRIGLSTTDRLVKAETGESPLTLSQVRKAARVYQRPLAVLLLPTPLEEDPPEVQFRRLRDAPSLPWPPAMRALSRSVTALQDEAAELFESLDEEPRWRALIEVFNTTSDPAQLAVKLREILGVELSDQKAAARVDQQGFRTFRIWREAIEDQGILVLQDGSLELDDMRGFASPHERVPAIVLNTTDDVRARLFTMFHELAHVFWTGIDEHRFDEFAAATLLPADAFARDFNGAAGSLLEKIDAVARVYGVTSDAAAVRVGWLKLAAWDDVNESRAEIRRRAGERAERPGGGNFYRNVVVRMGPRFVGRVLEAVDTSALSAIGASRVLGVRVGHLEDLRAELKGSSG